MFKTAAFLQFQIRYQSFSDRAADSNRLVHQIINDGQRKTFEKAAATAFAAAFAEATTAAAAQADGQQTSSQPPAHLHGAKSRRSLGRAIQKYHSQVTLKISQSGNTKDITVR